MEDTNVRARSRSCTYPEAVQPTEEDYLHKLREYRREIRHLRRRNKLLNNWVNGLTGAVFLLLLFLLTRPHLEAGATKLTLRNGTDVGSIPLEELGLKAVNHTRDTKLKIATEPYDRTYEDIGFLFADPFEVLAIPHDDEKNLLELNEYRDLAEDLKRRWDGRGDVRLCSEPPGLLQSFFQKPFEQPMSRPSDPQPIFHWEVCELAKKRFAETGDYFKNLHKEGRG